MSTIAHNINDDDGTFDRFTLPEPDNNPITTHGPFNQRTLSISSLNRPFARPRRRRPIRDPSPVRRVEEGLENMFRRRKNVYRLNVWAKHVGSNEHTRYVEISPELFRNVPSRLERLRPWLRRELQVITGDFDVEFLVHFIEGILVRIPIQSDQCLDALRPFLFEHTEHFIHELVSFARSPFEINTYDLNVQYDWPHLPADSSSQEPCESAETPKISRSTITSPNEQN